MAEDVKWFKTHCSRWDHGGCALLVGVEDGKITKIKGDPDGYLNKGYTCPKGRNSAERLNHPDRLQYPVKRVGERGAGKWQRLSWADALQETADGLNKVKEKYGAKGVAFGVGMPKGLEHFILIRLANLFGSPNVIASQDICHAPREITGVHTCGFYPVADLHNPTKLVMLFASNPAATNEEGQICSNLDAQLKNGADLIVVDPRRIDYAKKAGLWLRLRPGTAHALVLGMLNVVIEEGLYDKEFVEKWTHGFEDLALQVKDYPPEKVAEITWVPAEQIRAAARKYAAAKPAAIQWGNPIEHDVNAFHVIRGLLCLMAICGNLEVAGGNVNAYDPKIMGMGPFVRADLIPDKAKEMISRHYGVIPRLMTIAPAFFRKAILEGVPYPVKGYYAMCTNPMVAWADSRKTYEAFQKLDFMAVADLFMTPTAAMADIVFPVAHQFEMNDIGHYGIGHGMILARPKIVEPPPECWPDMKIMNELGKLMSPPELWKADHEEFLADLLQPSGLTYQQFCEKGYLKGPDRFKLYEEKGFRTPTGKVELRLSTAEKFKLPALPAYDGLPEEEDPDYPLILISSKSPNYLISSYRWVKKMREREPDPFIEIHPDTAARFGIKEGDNVRIETKYGAIVQKAVVSDIVAPQVVNASIGWWFPEGDPEKQFDWEKSNFNVLTSIGKLGKEYGTPNIKNIGCRIAKA